jgi:hypothetical protein
MLSSDTTAAVVLAVIIILVMLCVWPGYARVTPESIEGYWTSQDGKMYAIRPAAGSHRGFHVNWDPRPHKDRVKSYDMEASPPQAIGATHGIRGLQVGPRSGTVSLGGRHINWADGGVWTRQGLST